MHPADAATSTALVARELDRYDIDIAALSETRLADEGQLIEKVHVIPFTGKVVHPQSLVSPELGLQLEVQW